MRRLRRIVASPPTPEADDYLTDVTVTPPDWKATQAIIIASLYTAVDGKSKCNFEMLIYRLGTRSAQKHACDFENLNSCRRQSMSKQGFLKTDI